MDDTKYTVEIRILNGPYCDCPEFGFDCKFFDLDEDGCFYDAICTLLDEPISRNDKTPNRYIKHDKCPGKDAPFNLIKKGFKPNV